jgi:hypothetical protein
MNSWAALSLLMRGVLAHTPESATAEVVAAGALVALLVVIVLGLMAARALVRKSAASRRACGECGHFLEESESKCPFCGKAVEPPPGK